MDIKPKAGLNDLAVRVKKALELSTLKDAERVVDTVIDAIEGTLLDNLETPGFSLKLKSFAKLIVRHKPGILRKIPFTRDIRMTKDKRKIKFVVLGKLRRKETVE